MDEQERPCKGCAVNEENKRLKAEIRQKDKTIRELLPQTYTHQCKRCQRFMLAADKDEYCSPCQEIRQLQAENKGLQETISLAIGGIDALSSDWEEETKKDILAIRQTLKG